MKRGRRADEVVREVGPPEVAQVNRSELPAQTPGPGEFCPGLEVPEELRPELGEVVALLDVLLKKLALIFPIRDRLAVFRLLEPFEVVLEVSPPP